MHINCEYNTVIIIIGILIEIKFIFFSIHNISGREGGLSLGSLRLYRQHVTDFKGKLG